MKKISLALVLLIGGLIFTSPIKSLTFAEDDSKKIEQASELTQEDAKNLLIDYNDNMDYIYQGDANSFEYLKEKGLKGYVFLPNVPTDIGYYVDSTTSEIYEFHPSGYLQEVK